MKDLEATALQAKRRLAVAMVALVASFGVALTPCDCPHWLPHTSTRMWSCTSCTRDRDKQCKEYIYCIVGSCRWFSASLPTFYECCDEPTMTYQTEPMQENVSVVEKRGTCVHDQGECVGCYGEELVGSGTWTMWALQITPCPGGGG